MRTVFNQSVKDERVSCQNGSFENTGILDHSADLVVVAQVESSPPCLVRANFTPRQAFHWCLDYDAAAAEFSRILKPGGIVALIWNLEDRSVIGRSSWPGHGLGVLTIVHMIVMLPGGSRKSVI
jgi:hypothetical protein